MEPGRQRSLLHQIQQAIGGQDMGTWQHNDPNWQQPDVARILQDLHRVMNIDGLPAEVVQLLADATAGAHVLNDQIEHLSIALESNRRIGVAMGIVMTRHGVTEEQAFLVLRTASQNGNRKLRDVADEITLTGEVPRPPTRETR